MIETSSVPIRMDAETEHCWTAAGVFGVFKNLAPLARVHRFNGLSGVEIRCKCVPSGKVPYRRVLYVGKGALSGVTVARSRAGPRHGWKPVRVLAVRPRVSSALQPYLPYPNVARARARISKEGVRR